MTLILGWSKILQTKQLPEAKVKEALAQIEENAKRQAQLVDVTPVASAKVALAVLKKSQFDVLVCHIGLQETDGYTNI